MFKEEPDIVVDQIWYGVIKEKDIGQTSVERKMGPPLNAGLGLGQLITRNLTFGISSIQPGRGREALRPV